MGTSDSFFFSFSLLHRSWKKENDTPSPWSDAIDVEKLLEGRSDAAQSRGKQRVIVRVQKSKWTNDIVSS